MRQNRYGHCALIAIVVATLCFANFPVRATPCTKRMIKVNVFVCAIENQECGPVMKDGACVTTPLPANGLDCLCTGATPAPKPPPKKKKKCLSFISNSFAPPIPAIPTANSTVTYTAIVNGFNRAMVQEDGVVLARFDDSANLLSGSVTLSFGDFTDPANIPVEILDMSLSAKSMALLGVPLGPSVFRLPHAATAAQGSGGPMLNYNSLTGVLDTTDPNGINVWVDNLLDFALEVKVAIAAEVATNGIFDAVFIGTSAAPTFPASQNPVRISVGQPGRQADAASEEPDLSRDGRYVVFASAARNLVPDDDNDSRDVFVRDRLTGQLTRVSVDSNGADDIGHSSQPAISDDGVYVAFLSSADELVPNDNNGVPDVFVYNRQTRQTIRVSVDSNGMEGDNASTGVDLSANGECVAFASTADNLVTNDTNLSTDVFVHNLLTSQTSRVSVGSGSMEGFDSSDSPSISDDGQRVAYLSNAENLVPTDSNMAPDVFLRDRLAGTTSILSLSTLSVANDGFQTGEPAISGDGHFVAFLSDAESLIDGAVDNNGLSDIFVRDVQANQTTRASVSTLGVGGDGDHLSPVISADGRLVAFDSCSTNLSSVVAGGFRQVYVRDRLSNQTRLVSVDDIGDAGNDESGIFSAGVAISGDGNYVAFESLANDLVPGDNNNVQDIFLRDLGAATTSLAVRSPLPAEGNARSLTSVTALDGLSVAFVSDADNIVDADRNVSRDVFVRDLRTAQTTRVSVDSNGVEANDTSDSPSVTTDGRFVAFESFADNLVSNDQNLTWDIFVHDRRIQRTTRVSVDSNGVEGNDMSFNPSITAFGRFVAFTSYANNLVANDLNMIRDVFRHDSSTNETILVSVSSSGAQSNDDSGETRFATDSRYISDDGNIIAFVSMATNLVNNDLNMATDIFVRDVTTGQTTRVSVSSTGGEGNGLSNGPSLSADGRFVAFASVAENLVGDDNNGQMDVFVHDRNTGITERISLSSAGTQGNGASHSPAISASGRYVAFIGDATNLVSGDSNLVSDLFLHDRQTHVTERISLNAAGGESDSDSRVPSISFSGRFITLDSVAANLTADDSNGLGDVFLFDRSAGNGDIDSSSDFGLGDHAVFLICLSGPGQAPAGTCPPDLDADLDGDGDTDLNDWAILQMLQ